MAKHANLTDEELIQLSSSGQMGAYETLLRRYEQDLLRYLIRFTNDRALAEDAFQETFIQVLTKANQFDSSRRFKPWLYTVASNKARDLLRKKNRRDAVSLSTPTGTQDDAAKMVDFLSDDLPTPVEGITQDETRQEVRKIIQNMPDHQRQVLLLAYFQKLPYQEIADMLEIPLGTVKSRLHAAVANFADAWQQCQQGVGVQ